MRRKIGMPRNTADPAATLAFLFDILYVLPLSASLRSSQFLSAMEYSR
jgi:hypothetical protein